MTFILTIAGILLLLLLGVPVMLAILALEDTPGTLPYNQMGTQRTLSIQEILINHDPSFLIDTDDQVIELNESDVNALLSYFTEQIPGNEIPGLSSSAFSLELENRQASLSGSLEINPTPFGSYINFSIQLQQNDVSELNVTEVRLGSFNLPAVLYESLFSLAHEQLADNNNYQLALSLLDSINAYNIQEDQLELTLNWQTENLLTLGDQARRIFISSEQEDSLIRYYNKLAEISHGFAEQRRSINLNELLVPLFTYALQDNSSSPQQENQSIFLVLTAYLTDLTLENLVGTEKSNDLNTPRSLYVMHALRRDLAQHLIVSAAIASTADTELANILSIYKEVHDSRYSTGFSFSDLTANLAGTGFGQISIQSNADAEQLQSLLSQLENEHDFMPVVENNDGMNEAEFIQTFGSRDSDAFQQRLRDIEKEVSETPLFRSLNLQPSFDTP